MNNLLKLVNYALIGIVIGALVYTILIGPSKFNVKITSIKGTSGVDLVGEKINVEDTNYGLLELTPVEKCESEFDKYSEMGEDKYKQMDFSIILTKTINNDEEAKEFDDTYAGFLSGKLLGMDLSTFKEIEHNYPIIALLVEIRFNQETGQSSPISMIGFCSGDGMISEQSKKMLTLSN